MAVVINRSEAVRLGSGLSNNAPQKLRPEPRKYDDKPLPVRVSDHAPRKARIVNRVFEGGLVLYDLKIGEVTISDVGLQEVLEYVSPYHLEEFENEEFKKEEELLQIVEEENQRIREEEHERRRERARNKGVAFRREVSPDEDDDAMEVEEVEVATGRHGRARPSYKPFMKVPEQAEAPKRRRRKRDKVTGELLPLSDDGQAGAQEQQSSADELSETDSDKPQFQADNMGLPKRRRRKRDKVTGELMPLSPIAHPSTTGATGRNSTGLDEPFEKPKRPRRRRHPVTQELMPLGWRYDPNAEDQAMRDETTIPSIQQLSLSQENEPKRRRLGENGSPHRRSRSPMISLPGSSQTESRGASAVNAPLSAFKKGAVIDLDESDTSESSGEDIQVAPSVSKPRLLRRSVGGAPVVEIPTQPSMRSPSPTQTNSATLPVRVSPTKSSRSKPLSSSSAASTIPLQVDDEESSSEDPISSPAQPPIASATQPPAAVELSSSGESEDDELEDDVFVVEDILDHALSNPKTHPSHMGKEPVMLYKVKWENWDDPTWEPETSFENADVIKEYQNRVAMKKKAA